MKKILALAITTMIFTPAAFASFDVDNWIKIVNHFPVPLVFHTKTINPRNTNLPEEFTLQSGASIEGEIVHLGSDGRPRQEVLFRVNEIAARDSDHGFYNAFWGTYITGLKLVFNKYDHHPYEYGIEYSWTNSKNGDATITFCSEDEYKKHQQC